MTPWRTLAKRLADVLERRPWQLSELFPLSGQAGPGVLHRATWPHYNPSERANGLTQTVERAGLFLNVLGFTSVTI